MAIYYFADDYSPNKHPNAIQGNDSWNGLYPTYQGGSNGPKRYPWNFNFDTLQAGDSVLFAVGSAWNASGGIIGFVENPASTSRAWTNMITFDQYDPGTGVTGKPWFLTSNYGFLINGFSGTGLPTKGGYVFRNLKIEGAYGTADDAGIILNPPLTHIIVEDCDIRGFQVGVNIRQEPSCTNFYICLRNNEFRYCRLAGNLGSANWGLIESNYYTLCGNLHALTHAIYYGSGENDTEAHTLRHNTLVDNNIDGSGVCVGGNMTIRGKLTGTHIEGNTVWNNGTKFNANAYGISHFPGYSQTEYHLRTRILRNSTKNFRNHIVFGSAPFAQIKDNVMLDEGLVADGTPFCTAIAWPEATTFTPGDSTHDEGAIVTGNSFTSNAPRNGTIGIATRSGTDNSSGAAVTINDNTLSFGSNSAGSIYGFDLTEGGGATYTSISNNSYGGGNGWETSYTTLSSFQSHYSGLGTTCTGNTDI